jgi:cyanophycinase
VRPTGLILAVFQAILGFACGTAARSGHLLVAGGGTNPDNELIYSRFIAPLPDDAVIGIIPTASANPAEAAASAAKTLARHAGARRIEQFNMSLQNPSAASDPDTVRRIRECSALWFTGGVQSRITAVFRPPGGDTPAYAAACDVLARGGVIGGTSAGAAMMSDPMIVGGSSEDALSSFVRAEGEDSGFGMARGMGFFPYGLTDQHFLRRGRLGRLVVALERSRKTCGYGVEEGSAFHADLRSGLITALGPMLLVDTRNLSRCGRAIAGVRLSLLNAGDTVDGPTGKVNLPRDSTIVAMPASTGGTLPPAWSRGAVTLAMEHLAAGAMSSELRSEGWALRFTRLSATRAWIRDGHWSIHGVELELIPVGSEASRSP